MSKARTAVNEAAVQSAIAQREAKERAEKEASEARHKLELERQAKMRQAQAEAQKREAEKAKLRELAAKAKEQEAERKQQAEVEKILGKARHQAFESREKEGGGSNGLRRKRAKGSDDDEDEGDSTQVLTRAEKRALKMDPDARPAWAQRLVGPSGRSSSKEPHSSSSNSNSRSPAKSKRPRQNDANFTNYLTAPSALAAQGDPSLSIKERLKSSDYFVPIKLSAKRRDTRTQADYFQEKRKRAMAANGGTDNDPYANWNKTSKQDSGSGSELKPKKVVGNGPVKLPFGMGPSRATSLPTVGKSKASTSSSRNDSPSSGPRKRHRSDSLSSSDLDSDTPRKRPKQSSSQSAMRDEIWKLMSGKSRNHYADDVFSDDDDVMEVSMTEVAKEEARSLKVARQEDMLAEAEEARREAEKRRRKLARERE